MFIGYILFITIARISLLTYDLPIFEISLKNFLLKCTSYAQNCYSLRVHTCTKRVCTSYIPKKACIDTTNYVCPSDFRVLFQKHFLSDVRFYKQKMFEHFFTPQLNNYTRIRLIFRAQIFFNFKRSILYIVVKIFKNRNGVVSLRVEAFKYVIYFNRIRFVFTLYKLRLIEKQLLLLAII